MTKYFLAKLDRAIKRVKNDTSLYIQAAEKLQNAKREKSGIEAAQRAFDAASEKLGDALKTHVKMKHGIRGGTRRRHRRSRGTRKQK